MTSRMCFTLSVLAALFVVTSTLWGGIPEPDTVVYGETNGVEASAIVADVDGEIFVATSPVPGFYMIQIKMVDQTSALGAASAASIGDTVVILRNGTPAADPLEIRERGQVTRVDVSSGDSRGPQFRRGDVDGSGALEITDPIKNLVFQFSGTGAFKPSCMDALDFDDNGAIEVTDPISNLVHQFNGGAPPAAPGVEACGTDPTPDSAKVGGDLGCERSHESCL